MYFIILILDKVLSGKHWCLCGWRLKKQKESERVEIEQTLCAQSSDPRTRLSAEQSQSFDDSELESSVQICRDAQQQQRRRRETER